MQEPEQQVATDPQTGFPRSLKQLVLKLMEIGVEGYDRETRRRLCVVNLAGYLSALSSISYAVSYSLYDYQALKSLVWVNLLSAGITASGPVWHRFGSLVAPAIMTITVAVTLFYFVSVLGRDSGIQLNYIGAVAIAYVIFGHHHIRIIALVGLVCIVGHTASVFMFETGSAQASISEAYMRQTYILSATSIILILALIVWYAFSIAADAEARSERLLLNAFPKVIANRLREQPNKPLARRHENVTVLFADICGFTGLSMRLEADELVALLNAIFRRFDEAQRELGIEKIKTIGDAYMAACGVPEPVDDHARRMVELSFRMLEEIDDVSRQFGHNLDLRIGIASGPVTAGVIGTSRHAYDVWSPVVNLAARLEQAGEPGRIHVSQEVYDALNTEMSFEPAGKNELKGIGSVNSWFCTRQPNTG